MVHRGHGIGSLQMALTRSGEGFDCLCRRGVRFVVASVARARAEQYAADLWHDPDAWGSSTDRIRFADAASRERYLDTCGRILAAVNAQPGLLGDARSAALLEEKFLEGLFLNARLAPSRAGNWSRYRLARQAYRYLQDRVDDAPSIREMCVALGASYATLERAFHETYGLTPKAMISAMRLSGARRALLHPAPTATITGVALRWGFVEFGRFSVQYRHRYGEVPSETLRRVRGGALPVSPASAVSKG
jgi:AraC-like DNA-binding protein